MTTLRSVLTVVNARDRVLALVCRTLLASAFLFSGATKLLDLDGAAAEVRGLVGLEPAGLLAILVVIVQLGGAALLIAGGRAAIVGAAVLAAFTLVATFFGHPFWAKSGTAALRDATTFAEHLGLVGGLTLAAADASRALERTP